MAQAGQKIKNIITIYIRNLESLGISVQKVVMFGSHAKGTFKKDSDIDIAVISKEFEKMGLWDRAKYLGRAARGISYPIEAIGFSPSQVKKIEQGTILDEITRNGVEVKI
jgi:predicted nucleotidyltransferase